MGRSCAPLRLDADSPQLSGEAKAFALGPLFFSARPRAA